jgi:hypothetical protein
MSPPSSATFVDIGVRTQSLTELKVFSVILLLKRQLLQWGTPYRSWLRHYATSRKVAGSISDEVIGFLN